jgi:hypothetical protein
MGSCAPGVRVDVVSIVSLVQVVKNSWLIEITQAGEVVDAIQDRRVGRHQQRSLDL